MRHVKTILVIILISIGPALIGQTIERKVKVIDSLSKDIDQNKSLVEGIAEGTILNKRGKNIGGYSTYDLKDNSVNRTLYRIKHFVSTDYYYKTTFYYNDKRIIKATVIIEDWKRDNSFEIIYSAVYYFDNDQLIKVERENKKYSDSIDILEQGRKFQEEFQSRN